MNTIRVALPGYDAETDTNPDHFALYSDQNWILIKEKIRGTVSIGNGSSSNIAHGLSYIPFVLVFAEVTSGVWVLLSGDSSDYNAWIELNTTNLIINNSLGGTKNFKYYIFYDNIISGTPTSFTRSEQVLAVAKSGIDVKTATDPNDFIFHSDLNTFKIILEGTTSFAFTSSGGIQEFTLAHGLSYTPLVQGFAKFNSGIEIMSPNQEWVDVVDNNIRFNSVVADATNIKFRMTNNSGSSGTLYVKYYAFEVPL